MFPQGHLSQSKVQSAFNQPGERKPRTINMCTFCRKSKQKCSYSYNNTWPVTKCLLCSEKGRECSAPELKVRPKQSDIVDRFERGIYTEVDPPPKIVARLTEIPMELSEYRAEVNCRQAIFLLSLHTVLLICIEELMDLITGMIQPFQRHLQRESLEDNIPELSAAINCLKQDARFVNLNMVKAARAATGITFFLAQNALTTHYFRRDLSWGVDHTAVAECRDIITKFQQLGHTSLAYVLQVRLLQENITLSDAELKVMACSKNEFVAEVDRFFKSTRSSFEGRQMFTPKEVVRIPAFSNAISADGRPDYLGRSVAQVMFDAGVPALWATDAVHHRDILGRTALHQAVHRRDIFTIHNLLKAQANSEQCLGQCCLNKLSLLHIAACQGHTKMVEFLILHAPHLVEMPDSAGRTPFWYAARGFHLGVMKLLSLRSDVNMDHKDAHRLSPAAVAARDGRYELLGCLLKMKSDRVKRGIAPASERSPDHLPLLLASQARQTDCRNLILTLRSWKAGDAEYRSLLKLAKQWQDTELTDILEMISLMSSNLQKHFADADEFLLEPPKFTDKPPLANYPYAYDPRARRLHYADSTGEKA